MGDDHEAPIHVDGVPDDAEKQFNRIALLVAGPVVIGIVALFVYLTLHSASCATTIGTVPLAGLGKSSEIQLKLDGGTGLYLGLYVDSYSYSGSNRIDLDVRLLRDDIEVAKHTCSPFYFGGLGSGGGRTRFESACAMDVPPGGSTALRATATIGDSSNKMKALGLKVLIRRRE